MATIYQRPPGAWYIDFESNKKRHRYRIKGGEQEAKDVLAQVRAIRDQYNKDKQGCPCEDCLKHRKVIMELRLELLRLLNVVESARERRWRKKAPVCRRVKFSTFFKDVNDVVEDMT